MAGRVRGARRRPDAAAAAGHGAGSGWPPEQEYRRRPRHQPTHGRESPGLDHGKNRLEISSGTGAVGARGRWPGSLVTRWAHRGRCVEVVVSKPQKSAGMLRKATIEVGIFQP